MKQNFSIAGPFGELQGVTHECKIPERRRNVLVMAHGFRGSMEGGGRAAQLAEEISETVCTVVRFNFTWCTMLSNQVAELKAVLDFVRKTLQPEKLFLLGRSFGGATCIITAAGEADVQKGSAVLKKETEDNESVLEASWYKRNTYRPDGMVLWSAPNSLKKTFLQVLGEGKFLRAMAGEPILLADERGRDEIPAAFVKDLLQYDLAVLLQRWQKGPLLIIHGEKDCIVTPEQAKRNFEIAGGEKELYYMEGDDHHLALRCKEAGKLVKQWLGKNSQKAPGSVQTN